MLNCGMVLKLVVMAPETCLLMAKVEYILSHAIPAPDSTYHTSHDNPTDSEPILHQAQVAW